MTVSELREKLNEYPQDMPVFAEWETCKGYITLDDFSTERVHKGNHADECECLIIDVNAY